MFGRASVFYSVALGSGDTCLPVLKGCGEKEASGVPGVHFETPSCTQVGGRRKKLNKTKHQHDINVRESFWKNFVSF